MSDLSQSHINVAGAGLAELPIPLWIRLAKAGIVVGIFALVLAAAFTVNGWSWVADGLTSETALKAAATVTTALACAAIPLLLGWLDRILSLRRVDGRKVYGGYYRRWQPLVPLALVALTWSAAAAAIVHDVKTCPLPEILTKVKLEVEPAQKGEGLLPLYFWDYATFVNPDWLSRYNLVLPYEQGPPKKLLPKIYFEDPEKKAIVLELHGKRPRHYDQNYVHELFNQLVAPPRDWPLLWKLQKEAGLISDNVKASTLYLLRLTQAGSSAPTEAIGVPWESSTPVSRANSGAGRLFFWGPDGAVYQIKCPSPCALPRLLELVQFPNDPRGSHSGRLEWTKDMLKKLIAEPLPPEGSTERRRHENLLSLYLVSLLSLDPRDPEAFFHLGKLARNRETVSSAIKYGRDLGLEPIKILELEAIENRF